MSEILKAIKETENDTYDGPAEKIDFKKDPASESQSSFSNSTSQLLEIPLKEKVRESFADKNSTRKME